MDTTEKKVHGNGTFVPGSVRIIDFNAANKNLLVRGSSAFGTGNFHLKDFITTIKAAPNYASTGITLNEDAPPQIIDFCLIGYEPGNLTEEGYVTSEVSWFTSNPPAINGGGGPYPTCIPASPGNNVMIYWPVASIGGTVPTEEGGSWDEAAAVLNSIGLAPAPYYNFAGLVPAISAALNNNPSAISGFTGTSITNAVIYVHCDSGINRTGAAIISYLMQFGSNIPVLGIASLKNGATPHSLKDAQKAALVDPPAGNTPPGGVDQGVAEAYCNLLVTGNPTSPLAANCVPLTGSVN